MFRYPTAGNRKVDGITLARTRLHLRCHFDGKSSSRADSEPLDSRFNADTVVDGSADSLLATEITFSRLHRNVSEKELDLLQFSSSGMAQFRA